MEFVVFGEQFYLTWVFTAGIDALEVFFLFIEHEIVAIFYAEASALSAEKLV